MALNDKRWSIGKDDIDRDNRLISRDPFNDSHLPSDDNGKSDFSRKNIFQKILSLVFALLLFAVLFYVGTKLPENISHSPWFLVFSLVFSFLGYFLATIVLSKITKYRGNKMN
ncbi:hypothetical protein ACWN8V_09145 [Vagococcus elongatus]|uniref:Uncharacterized protein n=1 Tax=Vagococcus elongatus TaxID=180344 RepID=A0A430ASJ0_9ENTE|nr:hypothetical protein [Vagococcus elongatus]RSU11029.1 hypothetical protein CBF29_08695 [Vagococcus elongatus]